MYTFLIILTIIICLALAFFVLIQNPKGGGLDASFGGVSNNTFGAAKTTDFLEKATWGLAAALVIISIGSSLFLRSNKNERQIDIDPNIGAYEQSAPSQDFVAKNIVPLV